MNNDLIYSEKRNFLRDINNLKYEIDELKQLMDKVKFYNIDEIKELTGQIDAIHILIENLISFAYEREYLGDGKNETWKYWF